MHIITNQKGEGRDQEVDREKDGIMTSNIGKGQLGPEKREIDNSGEC